jgi:dephospho-CoA kinase
VVRLQIKLTLLISLFLNQLLISSPPEIQLQRLVTRDSPRLSEEESRQRVAAQLPLNKKIQYADAVIDNSGPQEAVKGQVDKLVEDLRRQAGWSWRIDWLIPPIGIFRGILRLLWRLLIVRVGSDKRRTNWVVNGDKLKMK